MLLAINIGNSQVSLGCIDGDDIVCRVSLASDASRTADEYAVLISSSLLLESVRAEDIDGVVISSVVPHLTDVLSSAATKVTSRRPLIVAAGVKTGLNIRIDDPAQLGCDLAVAAVGALGLYEPPMVLIGMGTATTFTVIDCDGCLIGAAIAPGVGLSLSALSTGTSLLPQISLALPRSCIGRNTDEGMKSGIVYGAASMVDGMLARIELELGYSVHPVAMGRHADLITSACSRSITVNSDLILRGLATIWRKNRRR